MFKHDPEAEGLRGFLCSNLEVLALMLAASFDHLKADNSGLTPGAGFPWFDEAAEGSPPEGSMLRQLGLKAEQPDKVLAILLPRIRARVDGDVGAEDTDLAICNKHFSLNKMVTSMGQPSGGLTLWSFAMFDALRMLGQSADGDNDPKLAGPSHGPRWPVGLSKGEFHGGIAKCESRARARFEAGLEAYEKAPDQSKTTQGQAQAMTVASSIASDLRPNYAATKPGSPGPATKKSRKSIDLTAPPSVAPAKVPTSYAGNIGAKLQKSATTPYKRANLLELHREMVSTGETTPRMEECEEGLYINIGEDKRPNLDTVEKLRALRGAIGRALSQVCPSMGRRTITYGWPMQFRETLGNLIRCSRLPKNPVKALELCMQRAWHSVIAHLAAVYKYNHRGSDDEETKPPEPVDFTSDPGLWRQAEIDSELYEKDE